MVGKEKEYMNLVRDLVKYILIKEKMLSPKAYLVYKST